MIFMNARRFASRAKRATLAPPEAGLRGVHKNHSPRKLQRENKKRKTAAIGATVFECF